jgi:hypothetical protein
VALSEVVVTGGWAATNTLREIVFTVEECNERIADAQYVLDNPRDYPIEVRVDADKAVRRYTRLREGAAKLALVEAALDAAAATAEMHSTVGLHRAECACFEALAAALRAVREGTQA